MTRNRRKQHPRGHRATVVCYDEVCYDETIPYNPIETMRYFARLFIEHEKRAQKKTVPT